MAPECTSLPTKDESVEKNIHSILNIIKITLVHIKLKTEVRAVFIGSVVFLSSIPHKKPVCSSFSVAGAVTSRGEVSNH